VPFPARPLSLLISLLAPLGCGGAGSPPDRATSDEQIRQVVVGYNVRAATGQGEAACDLMTEEKRERVDPVLVPSDLREELSDCASYWNWMGPRLPPAGRQVMVETQVATVSIEGEKATATTTNGAGFSLRWVDGAWKLD
jgi:hypothetical protein